MATQQEMTALTDKTIAAAKDLMERNAEIDTALLAEELAEEWMQAFGTDNLLGHTPFVLWLGDVIERATVLADFGLVRPNVRTATD